MQEIIVMKGIPGSGKSHWARHMVKSSGGRYKRVNKDDLRAMIDSSIWDQDRERFIVNIRNDIVREAIRKGASVIVDDTNFEPKHFDAMCGIARASNRDVTVWEKYIPCQVDVAIRRDAPRPLPVGEKIVRQYHDTYIEGHTVTERCEVFMANQQAISPEIIQGLPKALICDLDGTWALIGDRSPYDASTCDQDEIHGPVRDIVVSMWEKDLTVIFVSGREDKYREQTERHIKQHGTYTSKTSYSAIGHGTTEGTIDYQLHMRKTGDQRKDSIVKKEIYDEFIRGKFNVLFVLDDRPSVVRMWRYDLGLTVFQLNDQEF